MNVSYDFAGRVALVTGGGSGIGRASSVAFAAAGASVVVADIDSTSGEATVETIREAGGAATFVAVDVSAEDEVRSLVGETLTAFGRLDFAHNNAGIEGDVVPMRDVSSDNWRRVIDVDLTSVFYCMKAEIDVMVGAGGGAIVNTSSASGLIGGYNLSTYTSAKHGVVGLTRAAAMDYATSGIRINAICPGAIDTPFIAELPESGRDQLRRATPLGRFGQPAEMASAVLWLCSDGASYMTGHALPVDGGVVLGGTGTFFDMTAD